MTDHWGPGQPAADLGFTVDGQLPAGFDVLGSLRRMYPGATLTRGTVIPLGGVRVTVTAEALRLDPPGPAAANTV